MPREALAKFKFKLQPTKGFVPVWSNKGGGGGGGGGGAASRERPLSLWAPELDAAAFDLKQLKKGKNASVRIVGPSLSRAQSAPLSHMRTCTCTCAACEPPQTSLSPA